VRWVSLPVWALRAVPCAGPKRWRQKWARGLRISKQARVLRRALEPRLRGAVAPSYVSRLHRSADKASDGAGRCARGSEIRPRTKFPYASPIQRAVSSTTLAASIDSEVLCDNLASDSCSISRLLEIGSCSCQMNFLKRDGSSSSKKYGPLYGRPAELS
jgi:hypothetical protein